jgi:triacylglycerol esterase/lipase EstA (alpha/beta hydrolase family)
MPVLLVHGFIAGPQIWATMTSAIASALQAQVKVVPSFNYERRNTSWVTNPAIGPALAARITSLATASKCQRGPGKVIIVAHSMGGLAVRCAVDPGCAGKAANPDQIALVITLGTPNLGSPLGGTKPQKAH